jgi:Ca-activated chloride channel family protein
MKELRKKEAAEMRFEDPWALIFLSVLLPVILYNRFKEGHVRFSDINVIKGLTRSPVSWFIHLPLILRCCVIVLIVCALARPQSGRKETEILSEGVDIILTIDTSGSMEALDFEVRGRRVNRLEVVKEVVSDFIEKRPTDRIGMVVFGEKAFTQSPLTRDHEILKSLLSKISIGMAGDATAIGDAVGISVKRLKNIKAQSKVIILLTDGRNNAGFLQPQKAAELAKTFGVKVYTIGVGTKTKAPFLVDTLWGKRYIYKEVDLDEKTLKNIANITDAQYFRATDRETLEDIYDEIDTLEKTEVKVKEYMEYEELYHFFILPALLLFTLEIILRNTRLRVLP